MKKIKIVSILIGILMTFSFIVGCSNTKVKEEKLENSGLFKLEYGSKVEVDKVLCNVDGYEIELNPEYEDNKVKLGYTHTIADLSKSENVKYSIKIIDKDKVLFEVKNKSVDLSNDKSATITIIDNKDGFDIKVVNN